MLDELKKVKPLEINLDSTPYHSVPEVTVRKVNEIIPKKEPSNAVVYIVAGVAAVIVISGAVYIVLRKSKRKKEIISSKCRW